MTDQPTTGDTPPQYPRPEPNPLTNNRIEIRLAASIADPGLLWRLTYSPGAGTWALALDGCDGREYPDLSDVMHSENIPRSVRGMLRDLLTAAGLWSVHDHSQQWT